MEGTTKVTIPFKCCRKGRSLAAIPTFTRRGDIPSPLRVNSRQRQGLCPPTPRKGNGLVNMEARAALPGRLGIAHHTHRSQWHPNGSRIGDHIHVKLE